jgi:hypothetical protein
LCRVRQLEAALTFAEAFLAAGGDLCLELLHPRLHYIKPKLPGR